MIRGDMGFFQYLFNQARGITCADCHAKTFRLYKVDKTGEDDLKYYCRRCLLIKGLYCIFCKKVFSEKLKNHLPFGTLICGTCFKENTILCNSCKEIKHKDYSSKFRGQLFCADCYKRVERDFEILELPEKKNKSNTFKNNKYRDYCGVEIECINDEKDDNCFIEEEAKKYLFSQGEDGSLSDEGIEFVSVPMNGDLLNRKIASFCDELKKRDYYVNRKCGLHIHLEYPRDSEDYKVIKNALLFYWKFENYFLEMVNAQRRNCEYCSRIRHHFQGDYNGLISVVKSLEDLKRWFYETREYASLTEEHRHDKRYCWINLHSFFYRGTLEIRLHEGTIDGEEINKWFRLHLEILNYVKKISSDTLIKIGDSKESFLKIFTQPTQRYIQERWRNN